MSRTFLFKKKILALAISVVISGGVSPNEVLITDESLKDGPLTLSNGDIGNVAAGVEVATTANNIILNEGSLKLDATGKISVTGDIGITSSGAGSTIVNDGTIEVADGKTGVQLTADALTISGDGSIISATDATNTTGVSISGGTLTNSSKVENTATGISMDGGALINSGEVTASEIAVKVAGKSDLAFNDSKVSGTTSAVDASTVAAESGNDEVTLTISGTSKFTGDIIGGGGAEDTLGISDTAIINNNVSGFESLSFTGKDWIAKGNISGAEKITAAELIAKLYVNSALITSSDLEKASDADDPNILRLVTPKDSEATVAASGEVTDLDINGAAQFTITGAVDDEGTVGLASIQNVVVNSAENWKLGSLLSGVNTVEIGSDVTPKSLSLNVYGTEPKTIPTYEEKTLYIITPADPGTTVTASDAFTNLGINGAAVLTIKGATDGDLASIENVVVNGAEDWKLGSLLSGVNTVEIGSDVPAKSLSLNVYGTETKTIPTYEEKTLYIITSGETQVTTSGAFTNLGINGKAALTITADADTLASPTNINVNSKDDWHLKSALIGVEKVTASSGSSIDKITLLGSGAGDPTDKKSLSINTSSVAKAPGEEVSEIGADEPTKTPIQITAVEPGLIKTVDLGLAAVAGTITNVDTIEVTSTGWKAGLITNPQNITVASDASVTAIKGGGATGKDQTLDVFFDDQADVSNFLNITNDGTLDSIDFSSSKKRPSLRVTPGTTSIEEIKGNPAFSDTFVISSSLSLTPEQVSQLQAQGFSGFVYSVQPSQIPVNLKRLELEAINKGNTIKPELLEAATFTTSDTTEIPSIPFTTLGMPDSFYLKTSSADSYTIDFSSPDRPTTTFEIGGGTVTKLTGLASKNDQLIIGGGTIEGDIASISSVTVAGEDWTASGIFSNLNSIDVSSKGKLSSLTVFGQEAAKSQPAIGYASALKVQTSNNFVPVTVAEGGTLETLNIGADASLGIITGVGAVSAPTIAFEKVQVGSSLETPPTSNKNLVINTPTKEVTLTAKSIGTLELSDDAKLQATDYSVGLLNIVGKDWQALNTFTNLDSISVGSEGVLSELKVFGKDKGYAGKELTDSTTLNVQTLDTFVPVTVAEGGKLENLIIAGSPNPNLGVITGVEDVSAALEDEITYKIVQVGNGLTTPPTTNESLVINTPTDPVTFTNVNIETLQLSSGANLGILSGVGTIEAPDLAYEKVQVGSGLERTSSASNTSLVINTPYEPVTLTAKSIATLQLGIGAKLGTITPVSTLNIDGGATGAITMADGSTSINVSETGVLPKLNVFGPEKLPETIDSSVLNVETSSSFVPVTVVEGGTLQELNIGEGANLGVITGVEEIVATKIAYEKVQVGSGLKTAPTSNKNLVINTPINPVTLTAKSIGTLELSNDAKLGATSGDVSQLNIEGTDWTASQTFNEPTSINVGSAGKLSTVHLYGQEASPSNAAGATASNSMQLSINTLSTPIKIAAAELGLIDKVTLGETAVAEFITNAETIEVTATGWKAGLITNPQNITVTAGTVAAINGARSFNKTDAEMLNVVFNDLADWNKALNIQNVGGTIEGIDFSNSSQRPSLRVDLGANQPSSYEEIKGNADLSDTFVMHGALDADDVTTLRKQGFTGFAFNYEPEEIPADLKRLELGAITTNTTIMPTTAAVTPDAKDANQHPTLSIPFTTAGMPSSFYLKTSPETGTNYTIDFSDADRPATTFEINSGTVTKLTASTSKNDHLIIAGGTIKDDVNSISAVTIDGQNWTASGTFSNLNSIDVSSTGKLSSLTIFGQDAVESLREVGHASALKVQTSNNFVPVTVAKGGTFGTLNIGADASLGIITGVGVVSAPTIDFEKVQVGSGLETTPTSNKNLVINTPTSPVTLTAKSIGTLELGNGAKLGATGTVEALNITESGWSATGAITMADQASISVAKGVNVGSIHTPIADTEAVVSSALPSLNVAFSSTSDAKKLEITSDGTIGGINFTETTPSVSLTGGSVDGNISGVDNMTFAGTSTITGGSVLANSVNITGKLKASPAEASSLTFKRPAVAEASEESLPVLSIASGGSLITDQAINVANGEYQQDGEVEFTFTSWPIDQEALVVADTINVGSNAKVVFDSTKALDGDLLMKASTTADAEINQPVTVVAKYETYDHFTALVDPDNKKQMKLKTQPMGSYLSNLATSGGASASAAKALDMASSIGKPNVLAATATSTSTLGAELNRFVVDYATTSATAAKLAGELTPNNTGSAITATRAGQRMASSAISTRSNANRTGVNSGDMMSSGGFWLQYAYSEAEQDKKDGVFGYEAETSGFSLGMDTGLADMDTTVGFAYTYAKGDIKGKGTGSGSSMDTKNYIFSLYGSFAMDNMFVDGRISYSTGENNGHRTVGGERIKAEYDNESWGFNVDGGMSIPMGKEWAIEPMLAFNYFTIKNDSYRESASNAGSFLAYDQVKDDKYTVTELGAGVRFVGNILSSDYGFQPSASLMAFHDFNDDPVTMTAHYAAGGDSFVVHGAERDSTRYQLAASIGMSVQDNLKLTLNYSHDWMDKFKADSFIARLRYDF